MITLGIDGGSRTLGGALLRLVPSPGRVRHWEALATLDVQDVYRQHKGVKTRHLRVRVKGEEERLVELDDMLFVVRDWLDTLPDVIVDAAAVEQIAYYPGKNGARGQDLVDTASCCGEIAGMVRMYATCGVDRPLANHWRHRTMGLSARTSADEAEGRALSTVAMVVRGLPDDASGHLAEGCMIAIDAARALRPSPPQHPHRVTAHPTRGPA